MSIANLTETQQGLVGRGYVGPVDVVVVDDDPLMLESLVMVLEDEGFSVRSATNGQAALDLISERPCDILVSDVRMEGLDGIETIRRARQMLPEIIGIVVTGFAEQDTPLKAIRVGVDDYLHKPFELEAFVHAVRRNAEKVQLRRSLHEAEKFSALGQMAAGIAHEIRNPLQAIQNALSLIKNKKDATPEWNLRMVELAQQETKRLNHIVEGVMSLARMKPPRPVHLAVLPFLEDALVHFDLSEKLEDRNIKVRLEGLPVHGNVDPMQMEQVLHNLLSNALAFSPDGGLITVKADRSPGLIRISVCDQGPGVAHSDRNHLFELFFTTRPEGTGIGLALSRHIVRLHGGDLILEDSPVGAVFTVLLPGADDGEHSGS